MKWCRFQSGRNVAYGVIDRTTVTEVTGTLRELFQDREHEHPEPG